MANLLDKNNRVLIKTNEQLEDKIKEMRYNQDFMTKRFEEEMRIIRDKLEFYRINLNKVCATVYEGNSISIDN
jgi:cell division protein FtsB